MEKHKVQIDMEEKYQKQLLGLRKAMVDALDDFSKKKGAYPVIPSGHNNIVTWANQFIEEYEFNGHPGFRTAIFDNEMAIDKLPDIIMEWVAEKSGQKDNK
jgi:hypothetical protein